MSIGISTKAKIFNMIMGGLLALSAMGIIILIGWAVQDTTVLEVNNEPVPVTPITVESGQSIFLEVDFCKRQEATGTVKTFLIGQTTGSKLEIVWPDDVQPPRCLKANVPVRIPAQTPTDSYNVVFEIAYEINPIKDSYTTFRSQSFKVTNPVLE